MYRCLTSIQRMHPLNVKTPTRLKKRYAGFIVGITLLVLFFQVNVPSSRQSLLRSIKTLPPIASSDTAIACLSQQLHLAYALCGDTTRQNSDVRVLPSLDSTLYARANGGVERTLHLHVHFIFDEAAKASFLLTDQYRRLESTVGHDPRLHLHWHSVAFLDGLVDKYMFMPKEAAVGNADAAANSRRKLTPRSRPISRTLHNDIKLCSAVRLKLPFLMLDYYYSPQLPVGVAASFTDVSDDGRWLFFDAEAMLAPSCDLTDSRRLDAIFGPSQQLRQTANSDSLPSWGISVAKEGQQGMSVDAAGRLDTGVVAYRAQYFFPLPQQLPNVTLLHISSTVFPVLSDYWRVVTDIVAAKDYADYQPIVSRHEFTDPSHELRLGDQDVINILALVGSDDVITDKDVTLHSVSRHFNWHYNNITTFHSYKSRCIVLPSSQSAQSHLTHNVSLPANSTSLSPALHIAYALCGDAKSSENQVLFLSSLNSVLYARANGRAGGSTRHLHIHLIIDDETKATLPRTGNYMRLVAYVAIDHLLHLHWHALTALDGLVDKFMPLAPKVAFEERRGNSSTMQVSHDVFNNLFKRCSAVRLKLPFLMHNYYYPPQQSGQVLHETEQATTVNNGPLADDGHWLYIDWDTTVTPSCDLTDSHRLDTVFGRDASWGMSVAEEDSAHSGKGWYSSYYHDVPVAVAGGLNAGMLALRAGYFFPLPQPARNASAQYSDVSVFPVLTEYWRVVTDIVTAKGYTSYQPVLSRHTFTDVNYGLSLGDQDVINILALVGSYDATADAEAANRSLSTPSQRRSHRVSQLPSHLVSTHPLPGEFNWRHSNGVPFQKTITCIVHHWGEGAKFDPAAKFFGSSYKLPGKSPVTNKVPLTDHWQAAWRTWARRRLSYG